MKNDVMELVIFKTKPEVSDSELLKQFQALNQVLERDIEGFLRRTIRKDAAQNTWAEMIWWDSMEAAQAALEKIPPMPVFQQYCALLQEEGTIMLHLEEKL